MWVKTKEKPEKQGIQGDWPAETPKLLQGFHPCYVQKQLPSINGTVGYISWKKSTTIKDISKMKSIKKIAKLNKNKYMTNIPSFS